MWRFITVLCVIALCNCDNSEWRKVSISSGEVRGRKDPEGGLYAFYNIPYATAPMGRDRFKGPLPAPAWLQPLDAVDQGIICMQSPTPYVDINTKKMQENCLVTNVYVPDTKEKKLPVIVYVHGGAFEIGYGNMQSPKNLVKTKNVIVVNFNYRLGALGFLCLGSNEAPGNAGLKDQVALLRWVNRNIANFGGNPEDVTLAGYSAGSISVDLLMLSKSAEGLFSKVILESGANVASIAVQMDPLENAKTFANMLNFTNVDDFYALEEFYTSTPITSLLSSTFLDRKDATVLFSPCVERKGYQSIINDSPVNIIKSGKYKKVPILVGVANLEGSLHILSFERLSEAMNKNFSEFIPADLQFENEEEKEEVSEKVKEFYAEGRPVGKDTILPYLEYFGDIIFGYPTLRSVKLHVEAGHKQIYLYEYSFTDESTNVIPFTNVRRAGHCAQTMAVQDGAGPLTRDESSISEEFKQMKTTVRDLWYNFAAYGKPVPASSPLPAWSAVVAEGGPYMSLGKDLELKEQFLGKRGKFWEDIYLKYYRAPVPPPQPPPKHTEL